MLVRFDDRFPSLFDEIFRDFGGAQQAAADRTLVPAADVRDTEKAIEIHLDLPGVKPEAIDVKLENHRLTVTAERVSDAKAEDAEWIRTERSVGHFARTFTLPQTVDVAKPEATYKHGVLTLTLPKKAESQPRTLQIKVEA